MTLIALVAALEWNPARFSGHDALVSFHKSLKGIPKWIAILTNGHGFKHTSAFELFETRCALKDSGLLLAVGLDASNVMRLGGSKTLHKIAQLTFEF